MWEFILYFYGYFVFFYSLALMISPVNVAEIINNSNQGTRLSQMRHTGVLR